MRTLAGLCLSCALAACTFAPSGLPGDPGPSPSGDAAVPDAAPVLDAEPDDTPDDAIDTAPDAATDAGPAPPFCDPKDSSLVGCFAFENNPNDASRSALAVEATAVAFDEGVRGRAAVFTATSVLRLPETSDLDLDEVSVEMWVRPDELPVAPDDRIGLFDNDGQYSVFLFGGDRVSCLASGEADAAGVVGIDTWTHVACVHDGTSATLYIDGSVRATTTAGPLGQMPNGSNIGSNSPAGNERFIGRIDELRIWNRARTAGEVCEAAGCAAAERIPAAR